ncbi:MAG: porin [Acidobacteria bacterium]|nr:MAG: porin [Acidobacteriota bacterium]
MGCWLDSTNRKESVNLHTRLLGLLAFLLVAVSVLPAIAQQSGPSPSDQGGGPSAQGGQAPAAAPAQQPPPSTPPTWSAGPIDFSGAVDGYYSYNFQHPADRTNRLYNFNIPAQQFGLDLVEFGIAHSPDPIGGEIDLGFGQAFKTVGATDLGDNGFNQYVRQAFVSIKPAKAKGFELDFGKFVTSAGAEVIESYTNWNYSHSLLFAWAIPYFHFGVRTSWPMGKHLTGGFQLVNGWNNLVDNNSGKTIGPNVTITYSKWTWVIDYYGGPENPDTNKGWRSLFDTTLTLTPSSKASVYLNYDYGQNRNVNGAGTATTNSATWKGFAGALRVQAAPKVAFVGRGEWFNDTDGFNTGVAQQVKEVTFTGEYKIIEGLLWRGEYRHDWSDQPFFLDHTPPVCIGALTTCVVTPFGVGNSKHQNTLTFAVIAFFGPKR